MSSSADKKYRQLESKLFELRETNQLTTAEDDAFLEELADLWWDLSKFERECANERARVKAQSIKPTDST